MDELNPTVREQEIYEEMELTPEMVKSIRTLCATCLRHFVEAKTFKIALVPSPDKSMDTCTVCQTNRGHDYVVMHRYRVSTDKQVDFNSNHEADLPMQRKACHKFAESKGWVIVHEEQEEGVSGHKVLSLIHI